MTTGLPALGLQSPRCPAAEGVVDLAHAPALLVRVVAAPAARPTVSLQLLEEAVLEGAFAGCQLRRRVDGVRAGCLIARFQVEHGLGTV